MEYNLYNELLNVLGDNFKESTADFYILKQYMKLRLKHLVYSKDSLQHFGVEDSIFFLRNGEDGKVYQGFWSNSSRILTIAPVHSYQKEEDIFSFKACCASKQISFHKLENEIVTVEHVSEEFDVDVLINTKLYDLQNITASNLCTSFLENIDADLNDAQILADYEFACDIDDGKVSIESKDNFGQICEIATEHPKTYLSVYFYVIAQELETKRDKQETYQKKKTI